MKKIVSTIVFLTILVTACTPKQPAGLGAEEVQASAVALAFTISAATQNAVPSATLPPPTNTVTVTPLASPTSFVFPTLPQISTATSTSVSGDACNSVMAPNPGGPKINLHIDNQTKGWLSLSLWLAPTPFSCGFAQLPYVGASQKVSVSGLPEGCYYPSAYINDPKKPRAIEGPTFCAHTLDKVTLVVTYEGFKVIWP